MFSESILFCILLVVTQLIINSRIFTLVLCINFPVGAMDMGGGALTLKVGLYNILCAALKTHFAPLLPFPKYPFEARVTSQDPHLKGNSVFLWSLSSVKHNIFTSKIKKLTENNGNFQLKSLNLAPGRKCLKII